jgi:hypothetical protein
MALIGSVSGVIFQSQLAVRFALSALEADLARRQPRLWSTAGGFPSIRQAAALRRYAVPVEPVAGPLFPDWQM